LAWEATGCQDYARVDFRISRNGKPYVLEVNPNPDISPDAGLFGALATIGLGYAEFVENVISNALKRLAETEKSARHAVKQKSAKQGMNIRKTVDDDREAIMKAVVDTDFFRHNEVAIALEVLDASLKCGEDGEYQSYTAELDGIPVGWVCLGHTPCTVATYDIYWIVVSPSCQGKGVGKALMEHAEKLIAEAGGKVIVVETAGRAVYEPTRQFYLKLNYIEEARLKDFYAEGDDKVVYIKRV
jgi:ribosomal protein S18 acetylase RimI-like enzyme